MVTGGFLPSVTDSVTVAEPALTPTSLIVPGALIAAELEYAGLTRSHPQYANGWFGYAACLERSRKAARAKQAWQQFLALAGDDADSEFVRVAKDHVAGKR